MGDAMHASRLFGTAKRLHRLPQAKGRSEMRPMIGRKQAAASAAPAAADIGGLPSRDRHGRARRLGALLAGFSLCSLLVAASAARAGRAPPLGHRSARATFRPSTGRCRARRPPQPAQTMS